MDTRILMGIGGLLMAYIVYIVFIKSKRPERSGFILIRAWGLIIIGIMTAIICFIKIFLGLE